MVVVVVDVRGVVVWEVLRRSVSICVVLIPRGENGVSLICFWLS